MERHTKKRALSTVGMNMERWVRGGRICCNDHSASGGRAKFNNGCWRQLLGKENIVPLIVARDTPQQVVDSQEGQCKTPLDRAIQVLLYNALLLTDKYRLRLCY